MSKEVAVKFTSELYGIIDKHSGNNDMYMAEVVGCMEIIKAELIIKACKIDDKRTAEKLIAEREKDE